MHPRARALARARNRLFIAVATLAFAGHAVASPTAFSTFSLTKGGSDLSRVSGGQDYELSAAGVLQVGGGAIFPMSDTTPHRFELQAALSLGYSSSQKNEGIVEWWRVPVDLIYFYRNTAERFRLGAGITRNLVNRLEGTRGFESVDFEPRPATGSVVEIQKLLTNNDNPRGLAFGLRHAWITYRDDRNGHEADGSGTAFTMTAFLE